MACISFCRTRSAFQALPCLSACLSIWVSTYLPVCLAGCLSRCPVSFRPLSHRIVETLSFLVLAVPLSGTYMSFIRSTLINFPDIISIASNNIGRIAHRHHSKRCKCLFSVPAISQTAPSVAHKMATAKKMERSPHYPHRLYMGAHTLGQEQGGTCLSWKMLIYFVTDY